MGAPERIGWVDTAKAIGIVAIVVGHDPALPTPLRDFLYTFHVPLFFFVSGFLVKPSHERTSFGTRIRHNVRRLLMPYAFFWGASFALYCAFHTIAGEPLWSRPEATLDLLAGFAFATSDGLLVINGPLWFYTSLFTATLLLHWLARPTARWALPLALLGLAVIQPLAAGALLGRHLPWNLDLLPTAAFFCGGGYLVRREQLLSRQLPKRYLGLIAIGAFFATAWVARTNGKVDMSWQFFGRSYPLYVVGALTGIAMVIALSRLLPPSRGARYLSRNTIAIFSSHVPMYFAFSGIAVYLLGQTRAFEQDGTLPPLLYSALALLLCIPVVTFLSRYLPRVLGARAHSAQLHSQEQHPLGAGGLP